MPSDSSFRPRWKVRDRMHATICERGFDCERNTFTQSFGSSELDASLLLMPLVGFLPADDPRVRGTVAAIERELMVDGLVLRYRTESDIDGLAPGEGVFLPCSFWLANNYKLQHRDAEARALFERLLSLRNDVGLLAEEYDMPIVVHPYDRGAQITVGHRGRGTCIVDLVDGGNPKIEHAIYRREEGNPRAIRTYAHDAPFGISEDYARRKWPRAFKHGGVTVLFGHALRGVKRLHEHHGSYAPAAMYLQSSTLRARYITCRFRENLCGRARPE